MVVNVNCTFSQQRRANLLGEQLIVSGPTRDHTCWPCCRANNILRLLALLQGQHYRTLAGLVAGCRANNILRLLALYCLMYRLASLQGHICCKAISAMRALERAFTCKDNVCPCPFQGPYPPRTRLCAKLIGNEFKLQLIKSASESSWDARRIRV